MSDRSQELERLDIRASNLTAQLRGMSGEVRVQIQRELDELHEQRMAILCPASPAPPREQTKTVGSSKKYVSIKSWNRLIDTLEQSFKIDRRNLQGIVGALKSLGARVDALEGKSKSQAVPYRGGRAYVKGARVRCDGHVWTCRRSTTGRPALGNKAWRKEGKQ